MKKFFEKHDLFKLAMIFVLISIVLTWFCSIAYYSSGTLTTDDMSRAGLFDISAYGLMGLSYFVPYFTFFFVVAGFYKFLGSLEAYQTLTEKIANTFKGKEKLFVALVILIMGAYTSICDEYLVLLTVIPFLVSVLSKLKVDKITGVSTAFGGVLVGILGSTYSSKVAGYINTVFSLDFGYEIVASLILFAIGYLLLTYFTWLRLNKEVKDEDLLVDPFAPKEAVETKPATKKAGKSTTVVVKKHVKTLPLVITLIIMALVLGLAFINWSSSFGVDVFDNLYTDITEAKLFGCTVYSYILGSAAFVAFGNWTLFNASCILFLVTLVLKLIYRVKLDDVIEEYVAGIRAFGKTILVVFTVYAVLVFSVSYPTIPGLIDKILGLGTNFFTIFLSGAITSAFTVDAQYMSSLIGSAFTSFDNVNAAALALQASYGVIQFFAPTSVILVMGLSMLNVKFKDWFKFIWKFLLAITVVSLVVVAILVYL